MNTARFTCILYIFKSFILALFLSSIAKMQYNKNITEYKKFGFSRMLILYIKVIKPKTKLQLFDYFTMAYKKCF